MDKQRNMEEDGMIETSLIDEDEIFKNLIASTGRLSINLGFTKEEEMDNLVKLGNGGSEILGHPMFLTQGITMNLGYQEVNIDSNLADRSVEVSNAPRIADNECSSYVGVTGCFGVHENGFWVFNENQATVETDCDNEENDRMMDIQNFQAQISLETKLISPNEIFYLGVAELQY